MARRSIFAAQLRTGEHDLGGGAGQVEAVGYRGDGAAVAAQLIDDAEGVADAGAREPVEAVDVEPGETSPALASARSFSSPSRSMGCRRSACRSTSG
jgi:hypothetical protein